MDTPRGCLGLIWITVDECHWITSEVTNRELNLHGGSSGVI
jgi:hypothetical protein